MITSTVFASRYKLSENATMTIEKEIILNVVKLYGAVEIQADHGNERD